MHGLLIVSTESSSNEILCQQTSTSLCKEIKIWTGRVLCKTEKKELGKRTSLIQIM